MFNRTIMYAKLAWVYAKESLFIKRKFRWIDLALLPFGLCVLFLLLLGKLFGLTYKQISVVFNLWVQGAVLALSSFITLFIQEIGEFIQRTFHYLLCRK